MSIPGAFEVSDKFSHLAGHGALALYFAGLVPRSRWWKIFAFLLLFGAGIEFAQYAMQVGREGDPRDVVANSAERRWDCCWRASAWSAGRSSRQDC